MNWNSSKFSIRRILYCTWSALATVVVRFGHGGTRPNATHPRTPITSHRSSHWARPALPASRPASQVALTSAGALLSGMLAYIDRRVSDCHECLSCLGQSGSECHE
jgi:hypothetical protein